MSDPTSEGLQARCLDADASQRSPLRFTHCALHGSPRGCSSRLWAAHVLRRSKGGGQRWPTSIPPARTAPTGTPARRVSCRQAAPMGWRTDAIARSGCLKSFPLGGATASELNGNRCPRARRAAGMAAHPWRRGDRGRSRHGCRQESADLAPNLLPGRNTYDNQRRHRRPRRPRHGDRIGDRGARRKRRLRRNRSRGEGAAGQGVGWFIRPRTWSDRAVVRGIEFALSPTAPRSSISRSAASTRRSRGIEKALTDAQRAGALVVIAAGK